MPLATGFDHVATPTADTDLTDAFHVSAFEAEVTFEIPPSDGHPWMKIIDLGGGEALDVFEVPAQWITATTLRGALDPQSSHGRLTE